MNAPAPVKAAAPQVAPAAGPISELLALVSELSPGLAEKTTTQQHTRTRIVFQRKTDFSTFRNKKITKLH